ncbi:MULTISPECIES: hypothetical protein [Streptomycetaceae]|uniref:Uncharacterized protein n=1 Tax=Streptantibioticus cattleyicolor (strain ATCC 35852 / DSM 46488 / JCM 4925 / NBRC 14057 / NRRL 8057) TaxID=1003195 RepID=F8JY38_STREN|nr:MULTISPECIES: hypothetical protein [Streptomycetaceae]AEW94614.1 hypothetical protein SCATT_22430 [Streptantibioticus cattleyicolor NRRL 8057 = DSM 46488]MYS59252.1 hypothetical protein [Streptomyces sp. SID5468]CCB74971.1 protein of unknown function [Streptantibioticus cattleyicolor NRRL 8057 = DSM 46488]
MEDESENFAHLVAEIANAYVKLVIACRALPIPVELPNGVILASDAEDAVRRLLDIIDDQPIPEAAESSLVLAASFWLAAHDVLHLHMEEPHKGRNLEVLACLIGAERYVNEFAEWAVANKRESEDGQE